MARVDVVRHRFFSGAPAFSVQCCAMPAASHPHGALPGKRLGARTGSHLLSSVVAVLLAALHAHKQVAWHNLPTPRLLKCMADRHACHWLRQSLNTMVWRLAPHRQVQLRREALQASQARLMAMHSSRQLCAGSHVQTEQSAANMPAPSQARHGPPHAHILSTVRRGHGFKGPRAQGRALLACEGSVCMPVIATALASPGS